MSILGWMEMPEEDQPPETMWMSDDQLNDHFDRVRRKYESKSQGMEEVPGADMQDNQAVAALLK